MEIVGVFLSDGKVCIYRNYDTKGRIFESGDILDLPRNGQKSTVVILGIHEDVDEKNVQATMYFKRLCTWDNVDIKNAKLFGFNLAPIEQQVSQIPLLGSQEIEGPLLYRNNVFNMLDEENAEFQDE